MGIPRRPPSLALVAGALVLPAGRHGHRGQQRGGLRRAAVAPAAPRWPIEIPVGRSGEDRKMLEFTRQKLCNDLDLLKVMFISPFVDPLFGDLL